MYILSVLLILISSYLILSVINTKTDKIYGFLYIILLAFSQTVFSFELLSLFSAISPKNYIICNFIFLLLSFIFNLVSHLGAVSSPPAKCSLFKVTTPKFCSHSLSQNLLGQFFAKFKGKFYVPEIKSELKKIQFALKQDKLLCFGFICFCLFLIFQILNLFLTEIVSGDALSYYFPRALQWIKQGNFSHYITPNAREIIMPINFDMLYMLHFLFLKTEKWTSVYPFIGYLSSVYVLYLFLKELGYSVRRRLWTIIIFSSFALILLESLKQCSELSTGFLLFSGVFLFLIHSKSSDKISLFFSSLATALAFGVKTTAIIAIPALFFLFSAVLLIYKPKKLKQTLFLYLIFFLINFLIFSSYNYILNYLQFKNLFSNEELRLIHSYRGGWFCNFLKYILMILDTSGINVEFLNKAAALIQKNVLNIFGYSLTEYTSPYFPAFFVFSPKISLVESALGAAGLFVLLPSFIKSFFIKRKSKRAIIINIFALSFLVYTAVLSAVIAFMGYNNRYLIGFIIFMVPVLIYSYSKRTSLYKLFICLLILNYLVFYAGSKFYEQIRQNTKKLVFVSEERFIYERMKEISEKGKIALFAKGKDRKPYYIEKLIFNGFNIEKPLLENISSYDLKNYDYIIGCKNDVEADLLLKPQNDKLAEEICRYKDKDGKLTETSQSAVIVYCNLPAAYFMENSFDILFETGNYIVLKKTL